MKRRGSIKGEGPWQTPATLRVGKKGVTGEFLDELEHQIEKKKTVKVKLPRGLPPLERKSMAEAIEREMLSRGCRVVLSGVRGNSAVFESPGHPVRGGDGVN